MWVIWQVGYTALAYSNKKQTKTKITHKIKYIKTDMHTKRDVRETITIINFIWNKEIINNFFADFQESKRNRPMPHKLMTVH